MNLTSKRVIRDLLKKYRACPSRRLGQNFLIDKRAIKKIIKAAELDPGGLVLEIGPGFGVLTQELAKRVKKVLAIEKDQKMIEILKETLNDFKNVEVFQEDILNFNLKTFNLKPKTYKVVANLPFYLTAPVIRKFVETLETEPQQLVLVVQKEAAERISARPPDMSILAISVQFYAQPEIVAFISKKSFWPQPKVDSAILRIAPLIKTDKKLIDANLFFRIVKAGFSQPRKQLINNLSRLLKIDREKVKSWLLKNNIQPTQRAQTLRVEDWISLTKSIKIE